MTTPPALIVFDFDGVILESGPIKTRAFVELFSAYPDSVNAIREYHLANVGVSRYRKFAYIYANLLHAPLRDEDSEMLGRRFEDLVFEQILQCPAVPGAVEALATLHAAGVPLFVASGTPEEELRRIVTLRSLGAYFTGVFGSPARKPDILRSILATQGAAAANALFVGDGRSDYDAAREVGVPFVARQSAEAEVVWPALGVPVIQDLRDLPEVAGVSSTRK